jgi:hypothetical protein
MKSLSSLLFHFTTILFLGLNSSCSWASESKTNNENYFLVGCTPGDDLIKSQLGIQADTKIDFIRWDLKFDKSNTFILNIKFGENQPNTLGFIAGGQSKNFQGTYTISKNTNNEYYHLKAEQLKITLVRLNDNLFHLLTTENNLMVGNGGWSYTLNNKNPTKIIGYLPSSTTSHNTLNDKLIQVIYDGRTPCQEFATEHQMNVSESCFKLKWKLTLNRDSVTFSPTTYSIRKIVDGVVRDITGSWTIIKGTELNPDAIIYQLDPDNLNKTISLFVGDENVLYFLHKDKNLFIGNDNFSFTLNKRPIPTK